MINNGLLTIEEVIKVLERSNVGEIGGNIIFPSLAVETPLEEYAKQSGVILSPHEFDRSEPEVYHVRGKENYEYWLRCRNLESFKSVISSFGKSGQLPPYFIMAHIESFTTLNFEAVGNNTKFGRILEYLYRQHDK